MKSMTTAATIAALTSITPVYCWSADAPAKLKVTQVALQESGRKGPPYLVGRLYKIGPGQARTHIADVDAKGSLDPQVECAAGDKLDADVRVELMMKEDGPFFCKERLAFRFKSYDFGALGLPEVTAGVASARSRIAARDWGSASSKLTDVAAVLRQAGKPEPAIAAGNAAIAAAAKALGDENMERYVVRDITQDRRLVFSTKGAEAVAKLQEANNIRPSGQLDARTLGVMRTKNGVSVANQPK